MAIAFSVRCFQPSLVRRRRRSPVFCGESCARHPSLKLNGAVERAHWTHIEEFYEVTESSFDIDELKEQAIRVGTGV